MQGGHPEKNSADKARISQRGDRKINQDRCEIFDHENITVMVLADGMGGHPKGEVAAQILVDTAYHLLKQSSAESFHADRFIKDVFTTAHHNIINYGIKRKPPIHPRTTAVIVVIQDNLMQWSHLGDSRIYLFRHGRAHMRTMDHTRVELMRMSGEIEDADSQSKASGRSGVHRCLGGLKKIRSIEVTPAIRMLDNDILLMCSDGVWSQLKESELETAILQNNRPLNDRLIMLVSEAVRAGHPHSDNATAIALCWHPAKNAQKNISQPEKSSDKTDTHDSNVDSALDHLQGLINKFQ